MAKPITATDLADAWHVTDGGESVAYSPPGQWAPVTITVLPEEGVDEEGLGGDNVVTSERRRLRAIKGSATGELSAAEEGATILRNAGTAAEERLRVGVVQQDISGQVWLLDCSLED